jgi:hypothetical protein
LASCPPITAPYTARAYRCRTEHNHVFETVRWHRETSKEEQVATQGGTRCARVAFSWSLLSSIGLLTTATASTSPALRCNGSARIRDLQLGAVAFATTHNSMSSPSDKFFAPNQGQLIAEQLKRGIRGFQIDAYRASPGGIRSTPTSLAPSAVRPPTCHRHSSQLPTAFTEHWERPRREARPEVSLCYTFCELGAVSMKSVAQRSAHFWMITRARCS